MADELTIEDIAVFCKKKGFVFPSTEIYGGMAGFFDYGPLGVELKNNIKSNGDTIFEASRIVKNMNHRFIAIEGNIGAGKTTLSHLLSQHYNAKLVLEEFAENPFLAKFYENPKQYAFPLELFFLDICIIVSFEI